MITTTLIMSAMTAMAATSAQPLVEMPESLKGNPLVEEWNTPYQTPPFSEIELAHYEPAIDYAIELNRAEIDAIINNPEAPTFDNTIMPLENLSPILDRVVAVYYHYDNAMSSPEHAAIADEIVPMIMGASNEVMLNDALFQRIKSVYDNLGKMKLDAVQKRVVEKYYRRFAEQGAALSAEKKEELVKVNNELSKLFIQYNRNLLKATNDFFIVVYDEKDLAGLPASSIGTAAEEAKARNLDGLWVFTLHAPSRLPVLQYADNRDLREKIYMGYVMRGNNNNSNDNKALIEEMSKLRLQKAQLLGYEDYASYVLEANMAKDVPTVDTFLAELFEPALKVAKEELKEMEKIAGFDLESWDWWYYAEKVRKEKYNFDENELKPLPCAHR